MHPAVAGTVFAYAVRIRKRALKETTQEIKVIHTRKCYSSGADLGFKKGGEGTSKSKENAKINDIHDLLN